MTYNVLGPPSDGLWGGTWAPPGPTCPAQQTRKGPSPVGANSVRVILYTRSGCHLCDQAAQTLAEQGQQVQAIDIDANAELRKRWGTCVPVVEIDGKVRFRGKVDPILLRRIVMNRK